MGWQIEQSTGLSDSVGRCAYFKGSIYAFTSGNGVWRRDGVGPWTQVFNGSGAGWFWRKDDALYYVGGAFPLGTNRVYRSTDGIVWAQDVDLNTLGSGQASWGPSVAIGAYGDYLYIVNYDVSGAGRTYFYRRDLAGVWAVAPPSFGPGNEGQLNYGIVGFGAYIYWTNWQHTQRWNGATWELEPILDANNGRYVSVIGNTLYVVGEQDGVGRGWYFRTISSTTWSYLRLPGVDGWNNAGCLSLGGDGKAYAGISDGTALCIFCDMKMESFQSTIGGLNLAGLGVCAEADGTIRWGSWASGGNGLSFFVFVPDYNVSPVGGGIPPRAMDCDGDGDALYLGLYDMAGNPVLVRVALPLTASSIGSAMFQPGAGNAINVKCAVVGGRLAISGLLSAGGNDSVQVSEDGGLSFDNVAPAWGDTAQPLLVDPDGVNEVAVALDAAQDLYDTEDRGTTWTQRNAVVGYSPGAMARLPDGDELVVGDDAGNVIHYSPNRGQALTDITAPFVGNVAALEVV